MSVPPFIRVTLLSGRKGALDARYAGTVVVDGQDRWTREGPAHYVAGALRRCSPGIDHVLSAENEVLDTGCLTLAECIEASAQ